MQSFKNLIKSRAFIMIGSVCLILISFIEVRQYIEKRMVQKEINTLNQQADQLSQKNQDLQSFIAYLRTDEYTQAAAREQLNLKKPDEFVYSFTNTPGANSPGNSAASGTQSGLQPAVGAQSGNSQISNIQNGAVFNNGLQPTPSAQNNSQPPNWLKWWNYFLGAKY